MNLTAKKAGTRLQVNHISLVYKRNIITVSLSSSEITKLCSEMLQFEETFYRHNIYSLPPHPSYSTPDPRKRPKFCHQFTLNSTQYRTLWCLKKWRINLQNSSYLLTLSLGRPCSYVSSLLCCVSPPGGAAAVMAAARVTATSSNWLLRL